MQILITSWAKEADPINKNVNDLYVFNRRMYHYAVIKCKKLNLKTLQHLMASELKAQSLHQG
jgi:hypothetical protein